ncbi:hypothetical protein L198_06995 [Cryptococcus wingfieldii CBS 7118]|uniref:Uncharacterized protein n=1 Tax=Cryptococcus wingfieldii CBS 7118 TaxID=1295528 RepID=A0A1E3II10_9TREE|nr:hypothetical protein L198_06995 [Cryptococcus wingfieldii CBS 7118]ODN87371.1 hypothetical protein L198_06995 [Cryptococcus wingfieldii CBS 7118]
MSPRPPASFLRLYPSTKTKEELRAVLADAGCGSPNQTDKDGLISLILDNADVPLPASWDYRGSRYHTFSFSSPPPPPPTSEQSMAQLNQTIMALFMKVDQQREYIDQRFREPIPAMPTSSVPVPSSSVPEPSVVVPSLPSAHCNGRRSKSRAAGNPFHQVPEGSDAEDAEARNRASVRREEPEFRDGIQITCSAEQTGSWQGSFTLRPPASRSNFTRQEWIEKVEAEGGTSWLDGSPTSMEFDVDMRLFPVGQERRSNMIALVRSGTYTWLHL